MLIKRWMMGMYWTLGIIVILWLILAQSCLRFRKSDAKAKREFARDGVVLTTSTLLVKGRHIHYTVTGSDTLPTIIFVHGSPGSWDAFESYMKDRELLRHFRMVSVDRPGFGHSDYGMPEHISGQSMQITPLFTRLDNHKPAFLAGHSMGGPLAVKLVADNPGVFSGLVILSGSIDPDEEKPEKWRPWLFKTPLNYFVPGAIRPSNVELWYLKKDLEDLKADFSKITCPVYFVHGSKDDWVPPGNTEYGRKMLVNSPRIETILIPGANHFIPWTKFKEVKDVLLKMYR